MLRHRLHPDRQSPSHAYRPGHAGYVSEFTNFMDAFLEQHPDVARDQMTGMEIFWDHAADFEAQEKAASDSVPMKGYDYF